MLAGAVLDGMFMYLKTNNHLLYRHLSLSLLECINPIIGHVSKHD